MLLGYYIQQDSLKDWSSQLFINSALDLRAYFYSIEKGGLVPRWRSSALAWPLLDAVISPDMQQILCALHRGDSFVNLNPASQKKRVIAYRWNGFGFTGINNTAI